MATKVKLIADGVITPDQITLTTASTGTNTTAPATTAFVQQEISALVDSSPDALNTLNELAAALGDDANFSTTVTNSIATKAPLASPTFTGDATFDTTTLVVDATNNRVGIGTTSPSKILHLAASSPVIKLEDSEGGFGEISGSNGNIRLRADDGNTQASSFVSFEIDTAEEMRLTSTGLGIGTTSIDELLHLEDSVDSGVEAKVQNNSTGSSSYAGLQLRGQGNNFWIKNWGDSVAGKSNQTEFVSTAGSSHFVFSPTTTEKMRIDASGNVGIGTDDPLQKLHINSGTGNSAAIFESTDSTSQIWLKDSASSTTYQTGIACFGDNLLFNNGGEKMRIDSSGNVGIGTGSDTLNGILNVKGGVNSIVAYSTVATDQPGLFAGNNTAFNTSTNTLYAKIYGSGISASSFGVTLADYAIVATEGTDNNGLLIGSFNSAPVIFGTNNVERMRIDSSGHITFTESVSIGDQLKVGSFGYGATNNGEAWIGRASDRNEGTLTVQLGGGTTGRKFEIVDHDWTKVIFNIDGNADNGAVQIPATGVDGITINNTHAGTEPYNNLHLRSLSTIGGIGLYSTDQSHVRFKTGGGSGNWGNGQGYQWQLRMGKGSGLDNMQLYSWTGNRGVQEWHGSTGNIEMPYQAGARYGLPANQTISTTTSVINYSDTNSTYGCYQRNGISSSSGTITVTHAGIYDLAVVMRTEATPFRAPTQIRYMVDNSGTGSGTFVSWQRLYITSNIQSSFDHAPPFQAKFQLVAGARIQVTADTGSGSFILSSTSNTVNFLTINKIA